jgi:hypothetical protein
VVAAAISVAQAETDASPLPTSAQSWARVVYRFARDTGGLTLQRVIARSDGTTERLASTLSALLAQPGAVQPEQCDLLADRLLERRVRGVLAPDRALHLVRVLAGARDVLLDCCRGPPSRTGAPRWC